MIPVKFLELAQSELDDVFEAYEYQKENLGYDFIEEIVNTLILIKRLHRHMAKKFQSHSKMFNKGFSLWHYVPKG